MSLFGSLPPAEQARQLANPEGSVGLEVAEWLNDNNRQSNAAVIALLAVQSGNRVLEVGCGNGRAAPVVTGLSSDIRYVGIDPSPTMCDESRRFNAGLVATGQASFHLVSAQDMPFPDASFDRVFSIGVIHFWRDPIASLTEIRRVMRPGALALMQALDPRSTQVFAFARTEFGFHLRSADEWRALSLQAGFHSVNVATIETEGIAPDGRSNKRYTIRITARS
jgi:ubiquinone/menaquinone biosynthesis C-methylase UbiE